MFTGVSSVKQEMPQIPVCNHNYLFNGISLDRYSTLNINGLINYESVPLLYTYLAFSIHIHCKLLYFSLKQSEEYKFQLMS